MKDERIGLRQVSGMLARTIVCPLRPGDRLQRGQKFGMIKFGSTTELILPRPDHVIVHVKKGDKVRGGLTLLATLNPPAV
jgi:phosphatidylserine decarboxylase